MVGAGLFLLIRGNSREKPRTLDERMSFSRRDKVPYGMRVAYESLKPMFPAAVVSVNKVEPGLWEDLSISGEDQALVVITPEFAADEYEMKQLIRFVENGNTVFISTRNVSDDAEKLLKCYSNGEEFDGYTPFELMQDTTSISLNEQAFGMPSVFTYPGKQYERYFTTVDSVYAIPLGHNSDDRTNLIRLRAGKGSFWLHLAPLAFSNYFLLHSQNMAFYEKIMSVIPANTRKVAWDEYYRGKKKDDKNSNKNWLSVLMNMQNAAGEKPFRAAIWLLLFLLLIYVLMEMRRKQRFIPVIRKPVNASMEFVKTIGRLYHDKGDHNNLARKMTTYFLEHVRSRYKLGTTELGPEFVSALRFKSGADEALLLNIVQIIQSIENRKMTDKQLAYFHNQLESFYKIA